MFADDSEVELPASTPEHRRSFFLRERDQFLTNAGRWEVKWDDDQGTISHSMRPPALPQLPIDDHDEDDLNLRSPTMEPTSVHEIHISPSLPVKYPPNTNPNTIPNTTEHQASGKAMQDIEDGSEPCKSRPDGSASRSSMPPDVSENELRIAEGDEALQESMDMPRQRAQHATETTSHPAEPPVSSRPVMAITDNLRTVTNDSKATLSSTGPSKDADSTGHKSSEILTPPSQRSCVFAKNSPDKENVPPQLQTETAEEIDETVVVVMKTSTAQKTAAVDTQASLHRGNAMTGLSASDDSDTFTRTLNSRKRKAERQVGQRAREKKRRLGKPPPSDADDTDDTDDVVRKDRTCSNTTAQAAGADITTIIQPAPKRRGRPRLDEVSTPRASHSRRGGTPRSPTPADKAGMLDSHGRSRASSTCSTTYDGPNPRVYFASNTQIDRKKGAMKAFQELGGVKVTDINIANFLCVKDDKLVKSSSLLQAILQGIHIVTERWISAPQRYGGFPDPEKYIPSDPDRELEWSFEIASAVRRGREGFPALLADITVWFTQRLKQSRKTQVVRDLSNVASGLGATEVKFGIPSHQSVLHGTVEDVIIGIENDPQAPHVGRLGHQLYDKDLLTMAVLRGKLDLESNEFKVEGTVKQELDDE